MFHGLINLFRHGNNDTRVYHRPVTTGGGGLTWLGYLLLACVIAVVGQKVAVLFGPVLMLAILAVATVGLIYAVVSFRSLLVPFLVLIASVGFLRFVWYVRAPFLPDLFLDRISLIWLLLIFTSISIYQRTPLRKPFTLDLLLVVHATYIGIRVMTTNPLNIALWVASLVTPYLVFFLAKNIVRTKRQIHIVLIVLGVMSFYYTVTSISEKFHIDALLFPRLMAEPHPIAVGRSSGPFRGPGIFGDTMAMVLPVFLYFIAQARSRMRKVLFGLVLLAGFFAILFTYTRGSMLVAILAIGAVVVTSRKVYLPYMLPVIAVLPIAGFLMFGIQQDEFLEKRLETTNTAESRAGNLITGLRVWRDYPLFGCGAYQFQEFSDAYIAPVELPVFGTVRINQFRGSPAHDMYLGPLAEDGAVGAILQILIHVVILRVSFKKLKLQRRNDYFATYILPLFFGIYAVYLFGGLIISFRHFAVLGSLYYMAAGITYGYTPEEAEDSPQDPELS